MTSPTASTSPWRRRIRSATTPVQPVWWKAPIAAPLSPWKYSLKIRLSCQAGPVCQGGGDQAQVQLLARPGRVLDRVLVAVEPVVPLQDGDHQVVQREPDRSAPVGVPAEHRRGGLGRLIIDARREALDLELVGMVTVIGRQRPQP